MTCSKVVIISSSPEMQSSLGTLFGRAGLDAEAVISLEAWLPTADQECMHCLIFDMAVGELLDPDRVVLFREACAIHAVLVLTHSGDVQTAVQAIKLGAADVMQKPTQQVRILDRIKTIFAQAT